MIVSAECLSLVHLLLAHYITTFSAGPSSPQQYQQPTNLLFCPISLQVTPFAALVWWLFSSTLQSSEDNAMLDTCGHLFCRAQCNAIIIWHCVKVYSHDADHVMKKHGPNAMLSPVAGDKVSIMGRHDQLIVDPFSASHHQRKPPTKR